MTLGVRVIVRNEDNEILLVKYVYTPNWYLPGGAVEIGEDVRSAVKRELFEEVGIKIYANLRLKDFSYNHQISKRDHVAIFEVEILNKNLQYKKNIEIAGIGFFKFEAIPHDIDSLSRLSIEESSS